MGLDTILIVLFWALLSVWPLTYACYPVLIIAIARWRNSTPHDIDMPWPTVAVLVAAYNEEGTIERCVRSALAQHYPGGQVTVGVGLDGCTDRTADVLRRIGDPRLQVYEFPRQGKAATDNALISLSDAEVIATTSAGAEYSTGALEALVRPFRRSRVGCAGGVFRPRRSGGTNAVAEGSYFAIEYQIMRAESEVGILAKVSGTALAFRRSLWRPTPVTSDADISLPPQIAMQGHLVAFAPEAVVLDDGPSDLITVFRARRRMTTQGLSNVPRHILELARLGYRGHAASLTFHKVFRWLAPLAGIAGAIDAILLGLLGHWEFAVLLLACALGALVGLIVLSAIRGNRLSVAAGFVVSQLAFLAGAADFVRGSRVTRWNR